MFRRVQSLDFFLFFLHLHDLSVIFDDCYVYAEDYNLSFTKQKQINAGVINLKNWWYRNGKKLNGKKYVLMVFTEKMNAGTQNVEIREQKI